jgi:hypothetical protein
LSKGFEIILEPNPHDVVVGRGRDDEKFLFFASEMPIDLPGIFKRDEAIPLTVNDQGGEEYFFDPLETFLIYFSQIHGLYGCPKMEQDPHHTGKATLDNEPLHLFLIMVGQFQGRDASQRPPHHPQVFSQASSGELPSDLFKDHTRILNEIGEGGGSAAGSITPVIGYDQVHLALMIKGRDLVIIAHHLAVPVKKKDPGPFVLSHVETTRDSDTARHPYGEVKGVSRARGKIITGIEDELSQKRLVEKGIINHTHTT